MGPSWGRLGPAGAVGRLGGLWGRPRAVGVRLGSLFGAGPSPVPLWGSLGPSLPSWACLWAIWKHGAVLVCLGTVLVGLGAVVGALRGRIGRIANDQQSQSNQRTNQPSNQTNQPKTWICAERSSLEQCTRNFVSSIFQNLIWRKYFELTKFQFDKVCV